MNNYGDHCSHSIKVRVSLAAFRMYRPLEPGDPVEIVQDHEGKWYVLSDIKELHYHGRERLPDATVPDFKPSYQHPRSTKDPTKLLKSPYFRGALRGSFAVSVRRINQAYEAVDRLSEYRTCLFRFGAHADGFSRVSYYI